MKQGKYGKQGLGDRFNDIIVNALPYETDAEKAYSDTFTESRKFGDMIDNLVNEVAEHIDANMSDFQKLVTD